MSKKTATRKNESHDESDLREMHRIFTTTNTETATEKFFDGKEWVHEIFDGQKWVFAPLDKKGVLFTKHGPLEIKTAMFDAREWARAFLAEKGLPAAQDRERRRAPSIPVRGRTYELWEDDTPENHLLRVEKRHRENSPEAWAARITRAFLIGQNQGEAEVARLLSVVASWAMRHDANTGRSVREGGLAGAEVTKSKVGGAAPAVAEWRADLAKRPGNPLGPLAAARWIKRKCESASGLKVETIRRYLRRHPPMA